MGTIISIDFTSKVNKKNDGIINAKVVSDSRRYLKRDALLPAQEEVHIELANEHTSEPIKSLEDIERFSNYLINNGRYRDNMLFIVGINFGLRVSDLLQLRFTQLINDDLSFKTTFPILEKKTKNTRKVRRNRYLTINDAVMDAITLYLEHTQCRLDDYMFRSESNRGSNLNKPMSRMSVDRILKEVANTLNLDVKIATHTMRKTFAYHQMLMSNNDPRKLLLLQKMFGHSSAAQTLDYIGITGEEIEEAYMKLNLGSRDHYLVDSVIQETTYYPAS
ncbi:MAG: tyrosine-type recombinase/integrase [Ruminococcus sp.]|nr:tyrosine-type recombinase/integrase [Ruminococcus sp.]